jgi:hypothetical protein
VVKLVKVLLVISTNPFESAPTIINDFVVWKLGFDDCIK